MSKDKELNLLSQDLLKELLDYNSHTGVLT